MAERQRLGADAESAKGWWRAHRWLLLRRSSQIGILALFLIGPLTGVWVLKGNLSSSVLLATVPMTDPLLLAQMLLAGFVSPTATAVTGALVVLALYLLVGGRAFCAWVCPVNVVTDGAAWLRERLGIKQSARLARSTRYWLLAAILLLALVTGNIAWEMVNPVSMLHRGIIFGFGLGWTVIVGVFLFDLFVSKRGWCSHLCPVGAFYSLIGAFSAVRVRADQRQRCNDCMECYAVCPEPQVIRPALKGAEARLGPVVLSGNCTNCGRCIDICSRDVFNMGTRFHNRAAAPGGDASVPAA